MAADRGGARAPARGALRALSPPGAPDLSPALEALTESNVPAVVIGEVAGALHGWPPVLSGTGTVEVCGERTTVGEQLLVNGLTESEDLFAMAAGQRISVIEHTPARLAHETSCAVRTPLTFRPAASRSPACSISCGSPMLAMAVVGAGRLSPCRRSLTFSVLAPPAYGQRRERGAAAGVAGSAGASVDPLVDPDRDAPLAVREEQAYSPTLTDDA